MKFDGSEEQLAIVREIADNLSDPVFLVDRMFNVWYANRAFETSLGIRMNSKKYKDRPCHELLNLSICKSDCVMKKSVETRANVRLAEIPGVTINGDSKNFYINALPLENSQGSMFGSLIFLRDVTAETEIHAKYKELITKNSAIALSGQLESGNLIDVVQLFVFLKKSGELVLTNGQERGVMVFDDGRLTGIMLGAAYKAKALDRILAWQTGSFSFSPKVTVTIEHPITGSTDFMLMDAVRERDELNARKHQLPPLDARPQVLRIASAEADELEDVPMQIYEMAVEGKSVEQMLALEFSDARILLALLTLADKKIITW